MKTDSRTLISMNNTPAKLQFKKIFGTPHREPNESKNFQEKKEFAKMLRGLKEASKNERPRLAKAAAERLLDMHLGYGVHAGGVITSYTACRNIRRVEEYARGGLPEETSYVMDYIKYITTVLREQPIMEMQRTLGSRNISEVIEGIKILKLSYASGVLNDTTVMNLLASIDRYERNTEVAVHVGKLLFQLGMGI
ncbi:MAG: hypothetical protein PHS02_01615 [Candidatus ainarchaeum sp.]|nr:hypothetical protein [Candidatus ainarchaeum sp.]